MPTLSCRLLAPQCGTFRRSEDKGVVYIPGTKATNHQRSPSEQTVPLRPADLWGRTLFVFVK